MNRRKFLIFMSLLLVLVALSRGIDRARAQPPNSNFNNALKYHGKIPPAERKAAAERFKAAREAAGVTLAAPVLNPGGVTALFRSLR